MAQIIYKVESFWDAEANVWVATSEDVPGLVTEAETIEALMQKLRGMIPELVMLNQVSSDQGSISFQLTSHRQELIEVAS
jgi:predicted RNase H-like HicB family nuclease